MKKREDMIKNVHRRIDEYKAEQKKKRTRIALTAAPVCAAAVVCLGLWTAGAFSHAPDPTGTFIVPETATAPAAVQTTAQTVLSAKQTSLIESAGTIASEKSVTAVTVTAKNTHTAAVSTGEAPAETETEAYTAPEPTQADATEAPTAAEPDNNSGGGSSATIDRLGDAYINGEYYLQWFGGTYTPDQFIGCGSDFDGFYKDCGVDSEFYTAKESSDIIIVRLANGGDVTLKKYSQSAGGWLDSSDNGLY